MFQIQPMWRARALLLPAVGLCSTILLAVACAPGATVNPSAPAATPVAWPPAPSPDPRVGLRAGVNNAAEAVWNMRVLSRTPQPPEFRGNINSDLAFSGRYAIQGNFGGFQVWDVSTPASPTLRKAFVCPASQSDVSVYRNLLFVSGEDFAARLDCGTQGVRDTVSRDRLRGIRIFDISNLDSPRNVANVQTCRGSHTHTLLVDPRDSANVYIYVSGSAPVRPGAELSGCSKGSPDTDRNTALFRIEVIKVPVANPSQARIVSSPRIFAGLLEPPTHGESPADIEEMRRETERARAAGGFVVQVHGQTMVAPPEFTGPLLDSIVRARRGTGAPNAADSAALRGAIQGIVNGMVADSEGAPTNGPRPGPTQCHDITVYPAVGLAGGACEGYGMLIDIRNPENPQRIAAAADSNFAYWHSATFSNDGTKVLFSDEWGGGGAPKCRSTDRPEWGADAIFTIENRKLVFKSYYKLPAAQTQFENCVAHNGSLIPIPGRDVMVQAWYQGGISVFDWSDAARPREIAFFDRGPLDATRMDMAGSWSVYWYNGVIVSSEIARGLDILELTPSAYVTQNEIDAAKSVRMDYFNPQSQPKFTWPASFALSRAYLDQLERSHGLTADVIASARNTITNAERASGLLRQESLNKLSREMDALVRGPEAGKIRLLANSLRELGG